MVLESVFSCFTEPDFLCSLFTQLGSSCKEANVSSSCKFQVHYHRCPKNAMDLLGLTWDTAQFSLVRPHPVPVIIVRERSALTTRWMGRGMTRISLLHWNSR